MDASARGSICDASKVRETETGRQTERELTEEGTVNKALTVCLEERRRRENYNKPTGRGGGHGRGDLCAEDYG